LGTEILIINTPYANLFNREDREENEENAKEDKRKLDFRQRYKDTKKKITG